ncbi:unnamed protein product [Porites evermanni]|uniref:Uncharacterized protein n=1 Tax=Porites evermanni TaxID=104178 RepID=A0ABN8S748_9CNID|nr:unnamed protein product [Porites evermanni]
MTSEQLTAMTGNLLSFYGVKNEETLWTELHGSSLKEGKYGLGVVLISEKESCRLCGKVLAVKFAKAVNVVVYHEGRGTFMGCRVPKVCCNKSCKLIQHYGYYTFQDNKFYDDDWEKQEYFLSTGKTAFHMNLLLKFEVEILIGKLSFKEKADIYNEVHGCVCDHDDNSKEHGKKKGKERSSLEEELHVRLKMDRRRLEEAFLLYWCLKRVQEYHLMQLHELPVPVELDTLVSLVCPLYHDKFIKKWICNGCIVTPKLGSRFCENHIVDHKELDKEKNV